MWTVYIVRCRGNSLYTGVTTDITRRVKEHNSGKGAAHTRSHLPVKLVYSERYRSRVRAYKREAQIKSWTRQKKLVLIGQN